MNQKIYKELKQAEKNRKKLESTIANLKIERRNTIKRIKELKKYLK